MLTQVGEGIADPCRRVFNTKDMSNFVEIEISGIKRTRFIMRSLPGVPFEVKESMDEIFTALNKAGLTI
jgi:hypothetical protein